MNIFHRSSLPFLEEQESQVNLNLKIDHTVSLEEKYEAFSKDPKICLSLASLFPMRRPLSQILVFICDPALRTHPDFLVSPLV